MLSLLLLLASPGLPLVSPPADSFPSPIVKAGWLAANLNDPNLLLIHVGRGREAYDSAHIAGARFLDFAQYTTSRNGIAVELPEPERLAEAFAGIGLRNESRVVVYGELLAAARLWFTLDWLGLGNRAAILDGGLAGWRALGRPVTTEAPPESKAAPLSFRPVADKVVTADWIKDRMTKSKSVLIDARSSEEFSGEKQEDGVPRPGHIPGARNLDWNSTVTDGWLKPLSEIRTLFEQAGVEPGAEVVTYCRTGTRSSLLHLLARALGYRARMYDGSMMEWSQRTELPVVAGKN
jgi:thiosulfate/3-mercaptopyruvate sulfurtransferase